MLTVSGIYGVISFLLAGAVRIRIRIALGARRTTVVRVGGRAADEPVVAAEVTSIATSAVRERNGLLQRGYDETRWTVGSRHHCHHDDHRRLLEAGRRKAALRERAGARAGAVGAGGAGANVRSDADFVRDVAIKNLAGIELSRMALEKATSPQIKTFAQTMIADHGTTLDKLKSAVSGQAIDWPVEPDEKHRKTVGDLAKLQGVDFDRDYLKAMVEAHQDLAAKLESRLDVQSLSDWKTAAAGRTQSKALPEPTTQMRDVQVRPDRADNETTRKINGWAAETYPIAQKHLDTARLLENATKGR